jgi:hypothetical protein
MLYVKRIHSDAGVVHQDINNANPSSNGFGKSLDLRRIANIAQKMMQLCCWELGSKACR